MRSDFPAHWQILPLEDVMDAIIDYRGKTPKKTDEGIPLITAKIVKGGRILEPSEFIAESDYDVWMVRGLPEIGDVVVTSEAPLGEVAQLTDSNVALAQRIVTLRGKNGVLNNDFLLCAMQSSYVQHQLESRASGSTVKGIKQSELRKVLLPIPPEDEQVVIANHIRTLSNKIELNRQTNQTLEQIAQAIFKSWFVDFDPVNAKIAAKQNGQDPELAAMCAISGKSEEQLNALGEDALQQLKTTAALFPDALVESELGEVPEGWEVKSLDSICSFQNGFAFKSKDWIDEGYPVVKIGSVKPGFVNLSNCSYVGEGITEGLDRYKLSEGDILVGMTGYPGVTGLVPYSSLPVYLNQRVGKFVFNDKIYYPFVYCSVRSVDFKPYVESKAQGSAQANVSGKDIMAFGLLNPQRELILEFSRVASPIITSMLSVHNEGRVLAELRNTLLPKLLSGDLPLHPNQTQLEKSA
jgi:type I restriction enzyme S subunit